MNASQAQKKLFSGYNRTNPFFDAINKSRSEREKKSIDIIKATNPSTKKVTYSGGSSGSSKRSSSVASNPEEVRTYIKQKEAEENLMNIEQEEAKLKTTKKLFNINIKDNNIFSSENLIYNAKQNALNNPYLQTGKTVNISEVKSMKGLTTEEKMKAVTYGLSSEFREKYGNITYSSEEELQEKLKMSDIARREYQKLILKEQINIAYSESRDDLVKGFLSGAKETAVVGGVGLSASSLGASLGINTAGLMSGMGTIGSYAYGAIGGYVLGKTAIDTISSYKELRGYGFSNREALLYGFAYGGSKNIEDIGRLGGSGAVFLGISSASSVGANRLKNIQAVQSSLKSSTLKETTLNNKQVIKSSSEWDLKTDTGLKGSSKLSTFQSGDKGFLLEKTEFGSIKTDSLTYYKGNKGVRVAETKNLLTGEKFYNAEIIKGKGNVLKSDITIKGQSYELNIKDGFRLETFKSGSKNLLGFKYSNNKVYNIDTKPKYTFSKGLRGDLIGSFGRDFLVYKGVFGGSMTQKVKPTTSDNMISIKPSKSVKPFGESQQGGQMNLPSRSGFGEISLSKKTTSNLNNLQSYKQDSVYAGKGLYEQSTFQSIPYRLSSMSAIKQTLYNPSISQDYKPSNLLTGQLSYKLTERQNEKLNTISLLNTGQLDTKATNKVITSLSSSSRSIGLSRGLSIPFIGSSNIIRNDIKQILNTNQKLNLRYNFGRFNFVSSYFGYPTTSGFSIPKPFLIEDSMGGGLKQVKTTTLFKYQPSYSAMIFNKKGRVKKKIYTGLEFRGF